MTGTTFGIQTWLRGGLCVAAIALAGCDNGQLKMPGFVTRGAETPSAGAPGGTVELVERDVEAPEAFQVTEQGLWDGRPSLGGVWVAHPDVDEPERVIIRNRENGNFVIGALFRREIENPGPRLQVSSDAAEALGVLAGAPVELNVTALRREEMASSADVPTPEAAAAPDGALPAPSDVQTSSLDPIASAAAAIDAAESAEPAAAPAPEPATPAPQPASAAPSTLDRPYIQIGIFSIESNAQGTADMMRENGIVPSVLSEQSQGRAFWRVIVGPARDAAERAELLEKVKAQGFADAYAVAN